MGSRGAMYAVFAPTAVIQSYTAVAMNSGPLSERMCSGTPNWKLLVPVGRSVILAVRRGDRQIDIIMLVAACLWWARCLPSDSRSLYAPHTVSSYGSDKPRHIQARVARSSNPSQRIEPAGFYLSIRQQVVADVKPDDVGHDDDVVGIRIDDAIA